MVKVMLENVVK